MFRRLASRLDEARRRQFVGRHAEMSLFETALRAAEPPFFVLYLFGPGGIGKTTLLRELASMCEEAQVPSIYVDARNVEPAPDSFLQVLSLGMGLAPATSPLAALAERKERQVIFVDTYEILAPLDHWLSTNFLPQLPDNVLIVLAGRQPPAPTWHLDAGLRSLIQVVPIRNLTREESEVYLARRRVPAEQYARVLDFTHGHPLALSLVADLFAQRSGLVFQPEGAPDIIKILVGQLVQSVPGPAHRSALEACALVRLTTETILSDMLSMPNVHELFEWLRGLSFIESGSEGLFPHDLARETLAADVRWRNPGWFAELHRRARTHYMDQLQQTHGSTQQRVVYDYIFLHRDNPMVRPYFEWQSTGGTLLPDTMREGDREAILEMVSLYEGEAAAELAAYWIERQPQAVVVFRESTADVTHAATPAGLLFMLALQDVTAEDEARDAAIRKAHGYMKRNVPLRPGEIATFFRFWMARNTYQDVSPIQSLIFVHVVRHYLTAPGLVFTFFPCADPDFWLALLIYADLTRMPELDYEVGGHRYGVYGHNWRAVPPIAWLNRMAEREATNTVYEVPAVPPTTSVIVLSESEFAQAVRQVLRDFTHVPELQSSPLLNSRLITDQIGTTAGLGERVATLQATLRDAAHTFEQTPRDVKFYRVLYHTYFHPAPTQEQVSELLDVPFSTYRRHLKTAIERLTELLWQREIGGLGE